MIRNIKRYIATVVLLLVPSRVYAQPPTLQEGTAMIERVFAIFIPLGALLAVAMIVYGGFMWTMSNGDPAKVKQAQGTLTWSVIGLVFLWIFRAILLVVFDFLT
jgi:hypothetical protein